MTPAEDFEKRALTLEDLDQVYAIESSVYEDPWTLQLLGDSLQAAMTYTLALFSGQTLCAYSIYQVIYTEAHLLNLAVKKDLQAQGLGRRLLKNVMSDCHGRGAFSFFLEVRPSNEAAKKLYESEGFRSLMVRDKYYSNGEPAIVMVADL